MPKKKYISTEDILLGYLDEIIANYTPGKIINQYK